MAGKDSVRRAGGRSARVAKRLAEIPSEERAVQWVNGSSIKN